MHVQYVCIALWRYHITEKGSAEELIYGGMFADFDDVLSPCAAPMLHIPQLLRGP